MFASGRPQIVLMCALLANPAAPFAAESIGKAVHIKTEVTGGRGELVVNDPVYRDERIRTSKSGLGQFLFRDGTKLAVGWGSSVVIDSFVYDDSRSVKKLTIKATKGTFRWISGKSKSTAYEIVTPAGTIGVRGTVFDFFIRGDGTTAIVLLSGAARFCGAGGCRELSRRCDYVIARPRSKPTETRRVDRSIFTALGDTRALPFLSGNQKLPSFGGSVGGCGLLKAVEVKPDYVPPREAGKAETRRERPKREWKQDRDETRDERDLPRTDHDRSRDDRLRPEPEKPDREKPEPDKPDREKPEPDEPDREKPEPDKPDREKPEPDKPDREEPDREEPDREEPERDRPDRDRPERDRPERDRPDSESAGHSTHAK